MDKETYATEVIAALKGARETDLSNAIAELNFGADFPQSIDIVWLYQIDARASDAEVAATLGSLAPVLNSFRTGFKGRIASQISQLLQTLEKNHGKPAVQTAAFWSRAAAAAEERESAEVAGFVQAIHQQYAPYGVITRDAVRTAAQANGVLAGLSEAGLAKAIAGAGLVLVEPAELPSGSNPATLQSEFANVSGFQTYLGILFPDGDPPRGFTIIDGFECRGFPPLSDAVVDAAASSLNKRGGLAAEAAKKIPTALKGAHRDGHDYSVLVYRQLVDIARRNMQGGLIAAAVKSLTDLGLDPTEAGRIVLALGPGAAPVSPLVSVHEALEAGRLREARKAFSAASAKRVADTEEEFAAAERALDDLEKRVDDYRRKGTAALDSGDLATATRMLRDAAALASDDEQLSALVASLPPAPPAFVSVSVTEDGSVKVSWNKSSSHDEGAPVSFVVTRKQGDVPTSHRDGEVVGTVTGTDVVDSRPPVGRTVHYGVTAVRGQTHSATVTTSASVVPPVRDVQVNAEETSFTVSWTQQSEAVSVEVTVTTPTGRVLQPRILGDRATCDGLTTGQKHVVELVAVYPGDAGALVRSAPTITTAVPQAELAPVKRITVQSESGSDGRAAVKVSWRPLEGAVTQIWAFPDEPEVSFGQVTTLERLSADGGRRFDGAESLTGGQARISGTVSGGVTYFVAVTFGGDGRSVVVGDADSVGICEPVSRAKVVRNGDEVVVSWDWPTTPVVVNATWTGRSSSGEKTVRKSDYEAEGGLRFRPGTSKCAITLTTSLPGNEEWQSPPVTLEAAERTVGAEYDVKWKNKLLGMPEPTFVFRSESGCSNARILIGCREAKLMPRQQTDLDVLETIDLTLSPGEEKSVTVPLPKMRPTYWVRCLPENPQSLTLIDPNSSTLRKG